MKNKEKVLLAVPTYDGKIYCQDEWLKQVSEITYPVDVLIVDNSRTKHNYEYLKEWCEKNNKDWQIVYVQPSVSASVKEVLAQSMEIIRNEILSGGYDYWFSLETDVFCPPNTIEYLLCHEKQFIGLPYFHGSGENGTFLMMQDFPSYNRSLKISTIAHPQTSFLLFDGDLKKCYQGGIGCCLVQRSVIERVPFRVAEQPVDWFPDGFFHDDCLRLGIPYYITTKFIAEHFNDGKRWIEVQKKRKAFGI